jgi:hypothetical protein
MTAILNIPVASAENVLAVPLAAIHSDRGERFVYVKDGEQFVPRPVLIGITDYSNAEVQQGLSEGDVVALEYVGDGEDSIAKLRQAKQSNRLTGTRNSDTPAASGSAAPQPATARPPVRQGAERTPNRASGS